MERERLKEKTGGTGGEGKREDRGRR